MSMRAVTSPAPAMPAGQATPALQPADDFLPAAEALADAMTAATLLAVDPHGLKGARLRGAPHPARDLWLAELRRALPDGTPFRRLPASITDDRLTGGLDLAATLAAGRPVAQRGLLADADGGIVVAAMAERLPSAIAAQVALALETAVVATERDGLSLRTPARFALVALDEAAPDEPGLTAALADRLAFDIDLDRLPARLQEDAAGEDHASARVVAARRHLDKVHVGDEVIEGLCLAALALGIGSLRAPLLALAAARAAAALDERDAIDADDVALAARLVLAPRARCLPQMEESEESPEPPQEEPPQDEPQDQAADDPSPPDLDRPLEDVVLEAVATALPKDLLDRLGQQAPVRLASTSSSASGARRKAAVRGRVTGSRPGKPVGGARLAILDTLRAAAPWQKARRREREPATGGTAAAATHPQRILVRAEDFRIRRHRERTGSTTIFLVDASGSSALNRLAEAKGAVELLLADCYVRRDEVALIAFRGRDAELLLPPTRSLARAKRCLAALPAGGATPLASALDAGLLLAEAQRRRGREPALVVLSDGAPNIARDGAAGRPQAQEDALAAARAIDAARVRALLIDTCQRPQPFSERLASALACSLVSLPRTDARAVNDVVRRAFATAETGG